MSSPAPKRKLTTGYHIFVRHTIEDLKKTDIYPRDRLKVINERWKALSDHEKAHWKSMAELDPSAVQEPARQRPSQRNPAPPGGPVVEYDRPLHVWYRNGPYREDGPPPLYLLSIPQPAPPPAPKPEIHLQSAPKPEIYPQDEEAPEGTPPQCACVICMANLRKGTIKPCGHHLVCVACGDKLMAEKMRCPECRAEITKVEYHY